MSWDGYYAAKEALGSDPQLFHLLLCGHEGMSKVRLFHTVTSREQFEWLKEKLEMMMEDLESTLPDGD